MEKYLVFESKEQAERVIPLNQIKKIRIGKEEFCLAHTINGFVAFEKNCPHMGDDLSKGKINSLGEVVCPWHSYRFSLTLGDECENRCDGLQTYRTDWENGQLHVFV
ncbi:Ferredoxin subunit of nitrite reductase or a ring-hydroxylating dioxygenase [Reichenbachiella faecimaris]|uniref:Ferredoxin subunit of nitrite reductase or a ring-hydroxylating dioxygenase n=1 Tax=Reichenbachiella faecimaris TaxID=692418 RepID=A0A1W2GF28_REIFA|nr:Rieske (2Fe-2S) protein [Reichenbachiella faecimaris]SMD34866.1 Ferredoxin subunit of nitrite reductase or a ring-hydroxylating dioxygenase [Reichenbachiella faecimaris]